MRVVIALQDLSCTGIETWLFPLRTRAVLPSRTANVAELCAAQAPHVIATGLQFYETSAIIASLPLLTICRLDELLQISVVRAVASVRNSLADSTGSFGTAGTAYPVTVQGVRFWSRKEGRTARVVAVGTVLTAELDRFGLEFGSKIWWEEEPDLAEFDGLAVTAWGKQRLISDRGTK